MLLTQITILVIVTLPFLFVPSIRQIIGSELYLRAIIITSSTKMSVCVCQGWGVSRQTHLKVPRKGSASRAHLLKAHKSFPSEEGWGLTVTGGEGGQPVI